MKTIPIGGSTHCREARHYKDIKTLTAQQAVNVRSLANRKRSAAITVWAQQARRAAWGLLEPQVWPERRVWPEPPASPV